MKNILSGIRTIRIYPTILLVALSANATAQAVDDNFIQQYNQQNYGSSLWIDYNSSGVIGWRWSDGRLNAFEFVQIYSAQPTFASCPSVRFISTVNLKSGTENTVKLSGSATRDFAQLPVLQLVRVQNSSGLGPSALCRYSYIEPIRTSDSPELKAAIESTFSDLRPGAARIISGFLEAVRALSPNGSYTAVAQPVDRGMASIRVSSLSPAFGSTGYHLFSQSWPLSETGTPISPSLFLTGNQSSGYPYTATLALTR